MPREWRPPKVPEPFSREFRCPVCDAEMVLDFDGEWYDLKHMGRTHSRFRGRFESVIIRCPGCERYIEFTWREIHEERGG